MTRCNGYWARGKTEPYWYSHDGAHRLHKRCKGAWALQTLDKSLPAWLWVDTFATMEAAKDAAERGRSNVSRQHKP